MSRTRIVKGNVTKIVGKSYKIFSKENIENYSGKKIIQIGKEGGVLYGEPSDPPTAEIDILADAIVHFRPMNKWRGQEYGFDWMRIKDTNLPGDNKYSDIIGIYDTYPSVNNTGESNATLSNFKKSSSMYDKLKKEYSNPVYKIPWLLKDKKPSDYFASWLCVEKNKEIILSLRVLLKDKKVLPKDLYIVYDKTICEISTKEGKGNENTTLDPSKKLHFAKITIKKDADYNLEDDVKIKVISDIITPQTIKVLCDGKEAGFLKLYNNKSKKLNIVCVKVVIKKSDGKIKGKDELVNLLKQSLINVNFDYETLIFDKNNIETEGILKYIEGEGINISKEINGKSFNKQLEDIFKKEYKEKYANSVILYFMNEKAFIKHENSAVPIGGIGTPIGEGKGFMFSEINDIDVAHETLHSIGLGHSFGIERNINEITPYLYEYMKTENIMDYANLGGEKKFATWKWQWDKLRNSKFLYE